MKTAILFRLAFFVSLAAGMTGLVPGKEPAPRGHLVIVGGGGTPDAVLSRTLSLAGGQAARIVIFPQASELADTGEKNVEMWKKAGATNAVSIALSDPQAAVRAVQEAQMIWFPGGDQNKLMKAFENTGVPEAILKRYREGATVGGTSAGAAVISKVMITGEADLQSVTAGATQTSAGLGLWQETVVDQHFLKRQRQNRLLSLVLDHPSLVGVGIDEQTAVIVTGSRFQILGRSSVIVLDARKAQLSKNENGKPSAARKLRLHVLTSGMTFNLAAR
jgi:cyanophycinase